MPAPRPMLAVTALVAHAGCQGSEPPPPAPRVEPAVTVRDADGQTRLEARLVDGACVVTGETTLAVTRQGEAVAGARDGTTALTLGPGRTGIEVTGTDGAPRLRVHRAAGATAGVPGTAVDLLDMQGVPVARFALDDATGRVVDAARAPTALLAREGGRITVSAPGGAALAYVAGTTDLEVAALIIAPGVDADTRALLACERLLPRLP